MTMPFVLVNRGRVVVDNATAGNYRVRDVNRVLRQ
jgi:hypothetical protein